jgi:hypothetical protein
MMKTSKRHIQVMGRSKGELLKRRDLEEDRQTVMA